MGVPEVRTRWEADVQDEPRWVWFLMAKDRGGRNPGSETPKSWQQL